MHSVKIFALQIVCHHQEESSSRLQIESLDGHGKRFSYKKRRSV